MKKKFISIAVSIVMTASVASATDIFVNLQLDSDPIPEDPYPERGHRMPAAPVTCMVDLINHSIESSLPDEIVSYELRDEGGDSSIAIFTSDYDMTLFMSTLTGIYQFRVRTAGNITYIGYIEL